MKAKFKKAALLGLAVTFLLSPVLYAEGPYGGRNGEASGREERCGRLAAEIGLTAEQEAKLKEHREEFRNRNKYLVEKIGSKRKELKEELEKESIDRAKVGKIIGDIKDLSGEKLFNRVDKIIAMKSILTPEQFEKLQNKMEGQKRGMKTGGRNERRFWCR